MGDFLKGMMSARPMRDPHAELMRKVGMQDYAMKLRQRRAEREMPAFLRGDPTAQMRLAAMGIGRAPESPEAQQIREEQGDEAASRFEQQQAAQQASLEQRGALSEAGMAQRAELAGEAEESAASRFAETMGFRRGAAKEAREERKVGRAEDKAARDAKLMLDLESQGYAREQTQLTNQLRMKQEKRAADTHEKAMALQSYQMSKLQNVDAALPDILASGIDKYIPQPPEPSQQASPQAWLDYTAALDQRWNEAQEKTALLKAHIDRGASPDDAEAAVFHNEKVAEAIKDEAEVGGTIDKIEKLAAARFTAEQKQKELTLNTARMDVLEYQISLLNKKKKRGPAEERKLQMMLKELRGLQGVELEPSRKSARRGMFLVPGGGSGLPSPFFFRDLKPKQGG